MKGCLPSTEETSRRVAYAVYNALEPISRSVEGEPHVEQEEQPTRFIGLITLKSLNAESLVLPGDLTLPNDPTLSNIAATSPLNLELAYLFLPSGWGKGYATESIKAALGSCKRAQSFWIPFRKLYIRAIVNELNPASVRVMEKTGMTKCGVYETVLAVFLAGEWRERHVLCIFGQYLLVFN